MSIVDLATIQKLPENVKQRARRGEIVYLYHDTKPGWNDSLPFYLFACVNEACVNHKRLAIDYAHGYQNHNKRVTCPECGQSKYFPATTMSLWQKIKFLFMLRKLFKARKMMRLERKR